MNTEKIGRISGSYGVRGAMFLTDIPSHVNALEAGVDLLIGYSPGFANSYKLLDWTRHKKGAVIIVNGITTPETARKFKDHGVFASHEDIAMTSSGYLPSDIMGCTVLDDETEEEYGQVTEVMELPANDVWVVEGNGREIMLPAVEEVIAEIDIDSKVIYITPIEGMIE